MQYKVIGEPQNRHDNSFITRVKIAPPELLTFMLGISQANAVNVGINEMSSSNGVVGYLVSDTPDKPSWNDLRWSDTPPTTFTF